ALSRATATAELLPLSLHDALPISTGRPKGVCLDNRNVRAVWTMSPMVPGFDYAEEDVVLAIMPQFHVAGINNGLLALLNGATMRSEEHTSELQSRENLVCRLLLEK